MLVINLDWSEMLDSILLFIGIGLEKYQWNATQFVFIYTNQKKKRFYFTSSYKILFIKKVLEFQLH